MQDLEKLRQELQRSGQAEKLKTLAASPEGQRLGQMLDRQAVQAALQSGDGAALQQAMGRLLSSPEGQRLSRQLETLFRGQGHG